MSKILVYPLWFSLNAVKRVRYEFFQCCVIFITFLTFRFSERRSQAQPSLTWNRLSGGCGLVQGWGLLLMDTGQMNRCGSNQWEDYWSQQRASPSRVRALQTSHTTGSLLWADYGMSLKRLTVNTHPPPSTLAPVCSKLKPTRSCDTNLHNDAA